MQAKGMRRAALAGGKVHVFSNAKRIILQVRASGPDDNPLVTWAKAAAALSPTDAVQLAGELFNAALQHAKTGNKPANSAAPNLSSPKPTPSLAPNPTSPPAPKPKPIANTASKSPSKITTPP